MIDIINLMYSKAKCGSKVIAHRLSYVFIVFFIASAAFANSSLHRPFDQVLSAAVNDGLVDYKNIKQNSLFTDYLKSIEGERNFDSQQEELAYWINAYNALAIQGILEGRSPKSLLGRYKYFKKSKYTVGGKHINLYDLERKVIIPLGEPRIHFAINCASASCPKILSEAYKANKLEHQLEQVTYDFLNDRKLNYFDRKNKIANISKIFDWFSKDFINHSGSIQKYIAQYIKDPKLFAELRNEEYQIRYLKYDWGLNGTPP